VARIKQFEDIQAWGRARDLVKEIYALTSKGRFAKDFSLRDQIRRASVSVMSNIAEGFSRQTDREFIQFLYMSKGSVSEIQSQLYVTLDLGYLAQERFSDLYNKADEVAKLISGFIRYLKGVSE